MESKELVKIEGLKLADEKKQHLVPGKVYEMQKAKADLLVSKKFAKYVTSKSKE